MPQPRIAIIYYSLYNHVRQLAHAQKRGVEAAGGIASIFQVAETLPSEVLTLMKAPSKGNDPVVKHEDLQKIKDFDGFLFGIPTRFGSMPAQMKAFFDSTGQLWAKGSLVGKPAGIFTSVGTQGGGQETTALTTVTQFVHHGMIFVPTGYSFGEFQFDTSSMHGGTPYGAGTFAGGDGSRQPTAGELAFAEHQGKYFTSVATKLVGK